MRITVLTGAGISAESGIPTFRDEDGLWCKHRVEDVATRDALNNNPDFVNKFFNDRRRSLADVEPCGAHKILAELEKNHHVTIITQNIDDLHERGGSSRVIHVHGELKKSRCNETGEVLEQSGDIAPEDNRRPHVCLFGETPYFLHETYAALHDCDLYVSIGTSGLVWPVSGYIDKINSVVRVPTVEINPKETEISHKFQRVIRKTATDGLKELLDELS